MDSRDEILKAALELVPKTGWDEVLLDSVLKKLSKKISPEEMLVFTSVKELVSFHLHKNDEVMLHELQKIDVTELKIRERIKRALLIRFVQADKGVVEKTVKFLANPSNSDLAFKSLSNSCDKIWVWAGDDSTDFNYYSKRSLLAAVYMASLMYYLQSDDKDRLEIFIEERINDILKLGSLKDKIQGFVSSIVDK